MIVCVFVNYAVIKDRKGTIKKTLKLSTGRIAECQGEGGHVNKVN